MLHSNHTSKNYNKSILLWTCFVLCSFFNSNLLAQLSRKHYLPPLHSRDVDFVQSQFLYLSTFETAPFTVTVTDGSGNPIEGSPFVISKGNHVRINVGTGLDDSKIFVTEDELNEPITSKGLLLEAKKMFYASFRTEYTFEQDGLTYHAGYLTCKGESALGNSFRLGYIPQLTAASHNRRNFFSSVMATEDNTAVTISDYDTGVEFFDVNGNIITDTITVILNKGESYVVSGHTEVLANQEGFIGALVTSDKPIAVNTGNLSGSFFLRGIDFAIDQIVPITDIGTEYIAIKGNGSGLLEQLIVVAVSDNTDVFVNGSTVPYNAAPLNAGDYLLIADQYQGSSDENQNIYITTSEPSYLYQSLGGSGDDATTGFNFIPPITCFFLKQIDEIPDVKRIGDTNFEGNIAVVTTIDAEVTVNGVPTTATPELVQGNTEWETYRIDDLDGDITVASTGPLSVAYYGTSSRAGFSGYYSSFGLSPSGNSEVYLCTDDSIDLLSYVDGFPDPGGTWSPELSSGTSIFDPLIDDFGVYNYVLNTACTIIDITITVAMRAAPIIETDLVLSSCDSDFDLESYVETILDGQTDITVTFHETELEAETLENQLKSPYTSDAKTIYVRLQDDLSDCVTIGTLDLVVGNNSQSEDINYSICDMGNGTANFDLASQIEIISGVATGIPVSFYLTETDAESSVNTIDTSILYNSSGETLYTRSDNSSSCFSIGTLTLEVNDGPRVIEDLVFELCDDDTDNDASNGLVDFDLNSQIDLILDGQTAINVTFYELASDAENGLNPLVSPYNSGSKIVYTRLEQDTECYNIGQLELIVNTVPDIGSELTYALCDDDNDGLVEFDLDSQIDLILNRQTEVSVSFYESITDAENSTNALTAIYNSGNTTLYARLEDDLTACYSIKELILSIDGGVGITTDVNYELCDIDGDGLVDFDLNSQVNIISNDVTDATVSFYLTETNAKDSVNPIDSSNLYTSSGEILYTRVENSTSCFNTGTIELSIGDGPKIIENLVYSLCDNDVDGDPTNGSVDFDLESQIEFILDGQTGINLTFYESEQEANTRTNPLTSPYNSNSKTIYTRLEQQIDCYSVGELELIVNPLPLVIPELTYALCDIDNDGLVDFDLDSQIDLILNGQTGITVSFYETVTEAENSTNAVTSTYNSGNTTLYVRLENDATACFNIGELELVISPSPEVETNLIYELCDANGDGSVNFDLTSQIASISNGVTGVTVSFYLTETNAENAISAINTSTLYTSSGETLFTRVENSNSCFSIGSIELSLNNGPRIVNNLVYELCDDADGDATNGLAEFDLNTQIEFILDGQTNIDLTFYESEVDAEFNQNPLVALLYNSGNKTIYTRLEQGTDCFNVGELELRVNEVPQTMADLSYALCDDDTDGFIDFDLDSQIENVLNGQTDITVSFYETLADAENSVNVLNTNYTSTNATIYTRLENNNTACVSYGTLDLEVINTPEIPLAEVYFICEEAEGETNPLVINATPTTAGIYSYTWSPKNPETNANGEESANYTITEAGNYTVIVSEQNDETFCETQKTVEVIELIRPFIIDILGVSDLFITKSFSTIQVVTNTSGLYEYSLDNGVWQNSPIFNNVEGGKHEVTVRDINGCEFEDSEEFEIILFKPFFSPNDDNINDYWKIDGLSVEYQASIFIYDRFGKLLKQIDPNGIGWDGIFNGKNMPSDDYWVLIEYTKDGIRKNFQSHFSLIR